MLYLFILISAMALGYLAQWVGLCLVRGVNEAMSGKAEFLAATLLCGVWQWVAIVLSGYSGANIPFYNFSATIIFVLGGFLFGLGAAFNQGCGISTMSRLCRGELVMSLTVFGWVIGWCLVESMHWVPDRPSMQPLSEFQLPAMAILSVGLSLWAIFSKKERKKTWLSILAIGFLAGLLFISLPGWSPSSMLHDVSGSVLGHSDNWPSFSRFGALAALLAGMMIAATRTRAFKIKIPKLRSLIRHLLSGILMGIGGALALGGNDAQLLLALPTLSTAAISTVAAMLFGIVCGSTALKAFRGKFQTAAS
ncbi:YeeE/YedE thiosulfate transporter family protein [Pelagibaculum spongiae]|uniref:Sulphur transport domain-containing protein n=1 Tax=Pelagibaculum spongiae TaxID=2080658 RepID=A0A2V1GWD9_9GAMM|nr:YeeE/YedE thiosulfate transporter family protein [Pelagibaculum spongiae]PVZ69644.1 hypothetical protein DC094_10085 [Pelagibaculum spongiae]